MMKLTGFVLAMAAALSSGCSFLFVEGPSKTRRGGYSHCTESMGWPAFDGVVTGLQVIRTLYAASRDDEDYRGQGLTKGSDIGIGLGMTALFLASSIVGSARVTECREAEGSNDRTAAYPRPDPIMQAIRANAAEGKASGEAVRHASQTAGPGPAVSPTEPTPSTE